MINIKQDASLGSGFVDKDGNFVHNFDYIETASTATNLKSYGITQLASTAAKSYTLDAPYAGAYKEIVMTAGTTTINTVVCGSTVNGISVGGSSTTRKLQFNGINDAVILKGISTTKWLITSNVGSVAVATS